MKRARVMITYLLINGEDIDDELVESLYLDTYDELDILSTHSSIDTI